VRSEFDRAAVPSRELGLIAAPVVVSRGVVGALSGTGDLDFGAADFVWI